MKRLCLLLSIMALGVFQSCFGLSQADESEITGVIHEYIDAWNLSAGRGFADHYSEEGDFINIFGMHFHGREEIQERHNQILDTFLKDSTFTLTELELRQVNETLVIAFVRWNIERAPKTELGERFSGIFSHVFVKVGGRWEIAATQNTLAK